MVPVIRNRNWLPNWLEDFFGDDWAMSRTNQFASPSVNIIERDKCFCIEVAAPGMTKDDFRVSVNEGNELVVSLEKYAESGSRPTNTATKGENDDNHNRKHEHEKDAKSNSLTTNGGDKTTYLRREFSYGSFRRSFILPENIDKSKIAATMKNGVLTIDLPKKAEDKAASETREIAIG